MRSVEKLSIVLGRVGRGGGGGERLLVFSVGEGGEGGTESSCPGGGGEEEVGENLVSREGRGEGSHIPYTFSH